MAYILVAIVAGAVVLFTIRNFERVSVSLLVWHFADVPLAVVVLAAFGAGLAVAGIPLLLQRWSLRRRVRKLEGSLASATAPPADSRHDPGA